MFSAGFSSFCLLVTIQTFIEIQMVLYQTCTPDPKWKRNYEPDALHFFVILSSVNAQFGDTKDYEEGNHSPRPITQHSVLFFIKVDGADDSRICSRPWGRNYKKN